MGYVRTNVVHFWCQMAGSVSFCKIIEFVFDRPAQTYLSSIKYELSIYFEGFEVNLFILWVLDDCGDQLVIINSKEIALRGDEWKKRAYFHHTGYPGGASWTLAWELHQKDPTMVEKYLHFNYNYWLNHWNSFPTHRLWKKQSILR